MIISASRRTDIPAFYTPWLMGRLAEGFCTVPNPFNPKQVSWVSLAPQDVDAIFFWTRDPAPLLPHLGELEERGYRALFLYTVVAYPHPIERAAPQLEAAIETFTEVSKKVGPGRVVWRYDPILFSSITDLRYHKGRFAAIAGRLEGATAQCKVSVADLYKKTHKRLAELSPAIEVYDAANLPEETLPELLEWMARKGGEHGMRVTSCAETIDLTPYGIEPGKCIDDALLRDELGIDVPSKKDPAQRKACRCVPSRDIGMYDSCLHGCAYCYATTSFEKATSNHSTHDPSSPSLLGKAEPSVQMPLPFGPEKK